MKYRIDLNECQYSSFYINKTKRREQSLENMRQCKCVLVCACYNIHKPNSWLTLNRTHTHTHALHLQENARTKKHFDISWVFTQMRFDAFHTFFFHSFVASIKCSFWMCLLVVTWLYLYEFSHFEIVSSTIFWTKTNILCVIDGQSNDQLVWLCSFHKLLSILTIFVDFFFSFHQVNNVEFMNTISMDAFTWSSHLKRVIESVGVLNSMTFSK